MTPSSERTAELTARIVAVVRLLASGEVVSYRDVATTAGHPNHARFVGRVLQTSAEELPWWRVVTADGRLVPGSELEQARRLHAEQVVVVDGRVVASPLGRFAADLIRTSQRLSRPTGRSRRRMPS